MNPFHIIRGAEGHEKLLSKKDAVKISGVLFWTLCKTQLGLPSCHPGLCGILSAWVGLLLQFKHGTDTRVQSAMCANKDFFFFSVISILSFLAGMREMGMALSSLSGPGCCRSRDAQETGGGVYLF